MQLADIDITLSGLRQHYLAGDFTPTELMELILDACVKHKANPETNPVWIRRLSLVELEPYLQALAEKKPEDLPLYGVPFAIKDNIDLANIPTTAACPAFCHTPAESAAVVKLLIDAGALPVGKTNLDQFATGLVGTRSPQPWGACRNALNPDIISGGSSSGSAVAVAKGWVSFALGTDTAGSGRVPAALNNIVGLKPSKGLLSTKGVIPACRSLDCVSIFALTADDANAVFDVTARYDSDDSFSRKNPFTNSHRYFASSQGAASHTEKHGASFHYAIPLQEQLEFFGDDDSARAFQHSLELLNEIGGNPIEVDFSCFLEAARLLYEGPWVTERYIAVKQLIEEKPESLLDVIHGIIAGGKRISAEQTFSAQYQLQKYFQQSRELLKQADIFVTPTIGTCYTIEEVNEEPVSLNSNLGYYTNFMNLLDLSAIAVPTSKLANKVGFGITLFAECFKDKTLLNMARRIQAHSELPLGAMERWYKPMTPVSAREQHEKLDVLVCGAHLEGLPLNWQLTERGGVLIKKTTTASSYRMYALAGGPPFRPALVRDSEKGAKLDVEIWRIPVKEFGSFVNEIPAPLGIGKVELADGHWISGFICEPYGLAVAEEITHFGGWRAYLANTS